MRRILVLSFLGLGLALFRSPGFRPPQPELPVDSSLHVLGSLDLADSNHLYVRGHRLTGKVTATWRSGTSFLNDLTWLEKKTAEDATSNFKTLTTYMTWPGTSIANYTSGGMLLACNEDADRNIAQITLLEKAGWQLDKVRGLVSEGLLLEIAQQHGYRPRPPRVDVSLISYPPSVGTILRPAWRLLSPWKHPGTPAVVDSIVYTMVRYGDLSVLDSRTGREIRTVALRETGMLEHSVWEDSLLFISPGKSHMAAVNLNTERPMWSRFVESQMPDGCGMLVQWMVTRPALGGGRVYFASQNGKVYALNRQTGRKLWEHDTGATLAAPPVFSKGVVYVAGFGKTIEALHAGSGHVLWKCPLGEEIEYGKPLLLEKTIYLAGRNGTVFAVDAEQGLIRWSTRVGTCFRGQVVTSGRLLHVADDSGIYGLNPDDGRVVWTLPESANDPVCAAHLVFCVTSGGELLLIDPATGNVMERHDVAGHCIRSRPLIQNGRVFVATSSDTAGVLTCFDMPS